MKTSTALLTSSSLTVLALTLSSAASLAAAQAPEPSPHPAPANTAPSALPVDVAPATYGSAASAPAASPAPAAAAQPTTTLGQAPASPPPSSPAQWVEEKEEPHRSKVSIFFSYSMAIGLGDTHDFIGAFSGRGFTGELRFFCRPKISLGFLTGWQLFNDKRRDTYTGEDFAVTATQIRYFDAVPLLLTAHAYHDLSHGRVTLFAGLGLGAYWTRREINTGFRTDSDADWHFGLAPDVGVLIGSHTVRLLLDSRFNYAVKAPNSGNEMFFSFNIGVAGF